MEKGKMVMGEIKNSANVFLDLWSPAKSNDK